METFITRRELEERIDRLRLRLDADCPDWDSAVLTGRVNQYYFTGTMQDGLLLLRRDGGLYYFARRSYERAEAESPLPCVYPMESYRDVARVAGADCGRTYVESELLPLAMLERMRRHLRMDTVGGLDRAVLAVRAVKSPYELFWLRRAGAAHCAFLTEDVPALLREGMCEAEFVAELYKEMMRRGHQGLCRFAMFQNETVVGQIGFGVSSLAPTNFDGPGGAQGMSPAVPLVGSRDIVLRRGDLVFVDIAFGMNGYHSDKTQVYCFGGRPPEEALRAHGACMALQRRLAERLRPGALPSAIYREETDALDADFRRNFMGFGSRQAKFLGHGIGLQVDEPPVLALGFDAPLEENMVLALEPKKGIAGVGMVGVEDTYVVTPEGGACITGGGREIILV